MTLVITGHRHIEEIEMKVKAVVEAPSERRVTLVMSESHAKMLMSVADRTGGFPNGTRGLMDDIGRALNAAGIISPLRDHIDSSLRFNDGYPS